MEIIEEMFIKVIEDSFDTSKKLKSISDEDIFLELQPYIDKINDAFKLSSIPGYCNSELKKFIAAVKRYKPGYTIKDIKNIFDLGIIEYEFDFAGKNEQFEQLLNFSSDEFFKWFRVYGLKKHLQKMEGSSVYISNRNECLKMAVDYMEKTKQIRRDLIEPIFGSEQIGEMPF